MFTMERWCWSCRRPMESRLQMPMQRLPWRTPSSCWTLISTTRMPGSRTFQWLLRRGLF